MPIFELEAGGKTYEVDAPDMQSAVAASRGFVRPDAPDVTEDVLKSIPTGAAESVIGLADVPEYGARGIDWAANKVANIPEYGARAIDWAARKVSGGLGIEAPPRPDQPLVDVPRPSNFAQRFDALEPQSDATRIQRAIEEKTGKFYQPQTEWGQYGKTAGGFIPTMFGGPGGFFTKAATQVLAPTVATEVAGHYTKGTAAETPSRIAAALFAGPAAARAVAGRAGPTAQELQQAARTGAYKNPAVLSTPVPTPMGALADDILRGMDDSGAAFPRVRDRLERNYPAVVRAVDELKTLGPSPTVADVRSVRKELNDLAKGVDAKGRSTPEATLAGQAKRRLDEVLEGVSPEIGIANKQWAAAVQAKEVARASERGERGAQRVNSGLNADANLRSKIAAIRDRSSGYSPEAIKQMDRINAGTWVGGPARYFSNLLGGGGGLGANVGAALVGGTGGYFATGGEGGAAGGALGALALGRGLKGVSNASTRRQVRLLEAMVRRQAPTTNIPTRFPVAHDDLIRAIMRSEAGYESSR